MIKNVLITGASGNLGKVVCEYFSRNNYHVIAIIGLNDQDNFLPKIKNISYHKINLSDETDVNNLFDKLIGKYVKFDAAIFLAGGYAEGKVEDTGKAELDKQFNLNFETSYFLSKRIFISMKAAGGRLIFVSARPALPGKAASAMVAYALSKTLLLKLSEIYNEDGKKHNITSSVFIPSIIDTPANRKNMPEADFSKWVAPGKIAETMFFVCSESGSAIREGVYKMYGDS